MPRLRQKRHPRKVQRARENIPSTRHHRIAKRLIEERLLRHPPAHPLPCRALRRLRLRVARPLIACAPCFAPRSVSLAGSHRRVQVHRRSTASRCPSSRRPRKQSLRHPILQLVRIAHHIAIVKPQHAPEVIHAVHIPVLHHRLNRMPHRSSRQPLQPRSLKRPLQHRSSQLRARLERPPGSTSHSALPAPPPSQSTGLVDSSLPGSGCRTSLAPPAMVAAVHPPPDTVDRQSTDAHPLALRNPIGYKIRLHPLQPRSRRIHVPRQPRCSQPMIRCREVQRRHMKDPHLLPGVRRK